MSWFLICFFFFFCLFLFVTSCARNHYFYSGFRHMSKNHPSVCAWNHCKNSGFRHSTKKNMSWRAKPKKWDLWAKISRFVEAHRDISQMSRFSFFYTGRPETPIFVVFSGRQEAAPSKNARFWEPLKTRDRKKVQYQHICLRFLGSQNPYFCSVFEASKKWGSIKLSWSDENGVQLRTRKHIYIYLSLSLSL